MEEKISPIIWREIVLRKYTKKESVPTVPSANYDLSNTPKASGGVALTGNVPQIGNDVKAQYSLSAVDAVLPTSDKWSRTLTTKEAKARFPKLWDVIWQPRSGKLALLKSFPRAVIARGIHCLLLSFFDFIVFPGTLAVNPNG